MRENEGAAENKGKFMESLPEKAGRVRSGGRGCDGMGRVASICYHAFSSSLICSHLQMIRLISMMCKAAVTGAGQGV